MNAFITNSWNILQALHSQRQNAGSRLFPIFQKMWFPVPAGTRQKLISAPSSNGMLTSAPCKKITCAEVNDLYRS